MIANKFWDDAKEKKWKEESKKQVKLEVFLSFSFVLLNLFLFGWVMGILTQSLASDTCRKMQPSPDRRGRLRNPLLENTFGAARGGGGGCSRPCKAASTT